MGFMSHLGQKVLFSAWQVSYSCSHISVEAHWIFFVVWYGISWYDRELSKYLTWCCFDRRWITYTPLISCSFSLPRASDTWKTSKSWEVLVFRLVQWQTDIGSISWSHHRRKWVFQVARCEWYIIYRLALYIMENTSNIFSFCFFLVVRT